MERAEDDGRDWFKRGLVGEEGWEGRTCANIECNIELWCSSVCKHCVKKFLGVARAKLPVRFGLPLVRKQMRFAGHVTQLKIIVLRAKSRFQCKSTDLRKIRLRNTNLPPISMTVS